MAHESEFEKGKIVAWIDCGLSLHDIAKKFKSSIDVLYKKF